MKENQDIRIRLRAYDSKLLDNSASEIINTANSDNLYKDIEYSHQKNKLVKELRHIQKIKSDLIQNIILDGELSPPIASTAIITDFVIKKLFFWI